MNQHLITEQETEHPFLQPQRTAVGTNVGAVAIEQERAIAEAQGQLILAKRFPRDLNAAYAELMTACKSKAFAEAAFYSVPNRGTGPSIRFAEEVARCYGNVEYGHRELSRTNGKSEVEVYAWDKEKNNYSRRQITVMHIVDTKQGPKPCRDQADIDNKIANVASKQMRGRILALMPKWLVEEAIQACKATIAGTNDEPIEARVRKMTQAFAKYGVTTEHLERYIGHSLEHTLLDELVDLTGVYNALREGAKASDYFDAPKDAHAAVGNAAFDNLNKQIAESPAATASQANDNAKQEQVEAATPAASSPRRQRRAQQQEAQATQEQQPEQQQDEPAATEPQAQEPEAEQQQTQAAPAGKDLF